MLFEDVIWEFEDLCVQQGFLFACNFTVCSWAFECAEVVQVTVKLEVIVGGGSRDFETSGSFFWGEVIVFDCVDDALSEVK
jgi:hypothetical protein